MARAARVNPGVVEDLSADEQAAMDADRDGVAAAEPLAPADTTAETQADGATLEPEGVDDGTQADGQTRPQMVPHAALHEERLRRQETEQRLAEANKARQTIEERTNLLLQRYAAPQPSTPAAPVAPAVPALDADPVGHILGRQAQTEALLSQIVQAVVGQDQQAQAANNASSLRMRAESMEREFARETPDYPAAATHLLEARRQELMAAGWTDPAEIQQMLAGEAQGLAINAINRNENPAAIVYKLAKLRGYAPADPNTETGQAATTDAQQPNGAERVQTIARGQQQARSISQVRGQGPVPMTAERLLAMSDADFQKALDTAEGKGLLGT